MEKKENMGAAAGRRVRKRRRFSAEGLACIFCLTLFLAVLTGGLRVSAASGEMVTSPLSSDPFAYKATISNGYIQEPISFFDDQLTFKNTSQNSTHAYWNFEGTASDYSLLQTYMDCLTDSCYMKHTQKYYQSISTTFFSFGLDYTGTGTVTAKTGMVYDSTKCNVVVWGTFTKSKLKVEIYIPLQMEAVDLGFRADGSTVSSGCVGASALAGLYKLEDGSYQTSDGRLTAAPGTAAVLKDGTSYTGTAVFKRDGSNERDELWVDQYDGSDMFCFFAPEYSLQTDSMYSEEDLINTINPTITKPSSFAGYTWTLFFGTCHSGSYLMPQYKSDSNVLQKVTVRLMYWSGTEDAVYYVCAQFTSSPYLVEALCVVDLNGGKEAENLDGTYTLKKGETVSLGCNKSEKAETNNYKWEITEGSGVVTLSGEVGDYCVVTAAAGGTARVKLSYTYGYHYENPLTGKMTEWTSDTETHEWVINVSDETASGQTTEGDASGQTESGTASGQTTEKDTSGQTESGTASGQTTEGDASGQTESGTASGQTTEGDASGQTESGTASGQGAEVGSKIVSGSLVYKVTSSEKVTVTGAKDLAAINSGSSLKALKIPDMIQYEGKTYKVTVIGANAFQSKAIRSVSIGKNVQTIQKGAFKNCTGLSKVTGCASLKEIGKNAFYQCSSLKSVAGCAKLRKIGDYAFYKCSVLKSVSGCTKLSTIGGHTFSYCKKLTRIGSKTSRISLPAITSIGACAFMESGAKDVRLISESLKYIGTKAFAASQSLNYVKISSEKLTEIDDKAFFQCGKLTKAVISAKNLKRIGVRAFSGCGKLTTVTISAENLKKIDKYAFESSGKLTTLTIKSGKLSVSGVKNSLRGSSVKVIRTASKWKKSYNKYFAKSNSGKSVKITS